MGCSVTIPPGLRISCGGILVSLAYGARTRGGQVSRFTSAGDHLRSAGGLSAAFLPPISEARLPVHVVHRSLPICAWVRSPSHPVPRQGAEGVGPAESAEVKNRVLRFGKPPERPPPPKSAPTGGEKLGSEWSVRRLKPKGEDSPQFPANGWFFSSAHGCGGARMPQGWRSI